MSSQYSLIDQAKHQLVNSYKGGAVALASLIGMKSPAVLSNKVNANVDTHHLTLDESVLLQAITRDFRLLKAIAAELGHVAIELPTDDLQNTNDLELLDCWASWQQDCGETASAIRAALSDGNITQSELADIRREMYEDISRELELLQRLEALANA